MPVKSLSVKNFQSLKKITLDLKPFTVIVGKSDSGKSALVRAISAALFNTSGNDYITWGEKECLVQIISDGNLIEYKKGSSPSYKINSERFSAIGRGPFIGVEKLGFREISNEGAKIRPQISTQYDPPFLISDAFSPQIVASILGVLSDSIKVSSAKKMAETDLRAVTSELNYKEKDIDSTKTSLIESRVALSKFTAEFAPIHKLWEENLQLLKKLESLGPTITKYESLSRDVLGLESSLSQFHGIPPLKESLSLLSNKASTHSSIEDRYKIIVLLESAIRKLEESLATILGVIEDLKKKFMDLEKSYSVFAVLEKARGLKAEVVKFEQEKSSLDQKLLGLRMEISTIPVCKECGREV